MISPNWPRVVTNGDSKDLYYRIGETHEIEIAFEVKRVECSHGVGAIITDSGISFTNPVSDFLCKVTI